MTSLVCALPAMQIALFNIALFVYSQDNQSSNGTFVNNNRCSISKDQEPHEVFSGDVVQFGISVVENAGNAEKVNRYL